MKKCKNNLRIWYTKIIVKIKCKFWDLLVTKPGGLTTTESLASGLPIIVINPIPGQEVENTLFLEEKGVAVWVKNDEDSEIMISKILSDPEELSHMKIRSKLLAKKNST